jgi:hypothetical protein
MSRNLIPSFNYAEFTNLCSSFDIFANIFGFWVFIWRAHFVNEISLIGYMYILANG